jgi:hypothetical protein
MTRTQSDVEVHYPAAVHHEHAHVKLVQPQPVHEPQPQLSQHHEHVSNFPHPINVGPVAHRLLVHMVVLTVLVSCSLFYFWNEFSLATNLWAAFWSYLILAIGFVGAYSKHHGLLSLVWVSFFSV